MITENRGTDMTVIEVRGTKTFKAMIDIPTELLDLIRANKEYDHSDLSQLITDADHRIDKVYIDLYDEKDCVILEDQEIY